MKFSGVDPSIIRELSGIYKPFPKAFKELISNAYDADAQSVRIQIDLESRRISIIDDGVGMTPFEFRRDFTKLGGSEKAKRSITDGLGREKIGCKGIGFLAVARYCDRMIVHTHGPRTHREVVRIKPGTKRLSAATALNTPLPGKGRLERLRIRKAYWEGSRTALKIGVRGINYNSSTATLELASALRRSSRGRSVLVELEFKCPGLGLIATLDFARLLQFAHKKDLYELNSFCSMEYEDVPKNASYTKVQLEGIHTSIIEDLAHAPRGPKANAIEQRSGRERLQWHLERTIPLPYPVTPWTRKGKLIRAESKKTIQSLPDVTLQWGDEPPITLGRVIYANKPTSLENVAFSIIPVQIEERDLRATGYVLATSSVITPAEFRGLNIRSGNVAIGDSHFFGLERTLTGAQRAALQQISGEIAIIKGLNTPEALNPGRESFYEDNAQARKLRKHLAGEPGTLGGVIKRAINRVLEHSQLSGTARNYIAQAQRRRTTFLSCAAAINRHYYDGYKTAFAGFFNNGGSKPLALKNTPSVSLRPPSRLREWSIKHKAGLRAGFTIDQEDKKIYFNYEDEVWDQLIFVGGEHYLIEAKRGQARDPLCEFDTADKRIYLNWMHPLKVETEESQFVKQALLWSLAFELLDTPKQVMELGMLLLTHHEK